MELKTVVDNRTVGEILREARIARDQDFAQVCEQLRIRRAYMEAIEDGRFGDLPGSTYAIGFVRTYSEYLGLDVTKMVAKYKQEASDFEDQTRLVFPEPMPASRGPTATVIVFAVVLLAGSYAGWLYLSNKDREQIELVPPLPQALQNLIDSLPTAGTDPNPEPAEPRPSAEAAAGGDPAAETQPAAPATPDPAVESAPEPAQNAPETPASVPETPAVVNETITAETPPVPSDGDAAAEPEPSASETVPAVAPTPETPVDPAQDSGQAAAIVTDQAPVTDPAPEQTVANAVPAAPETAPQSEPAADTTELPPATVAEAETAEPAVAEPAVPAPAPTLAPTLAPTPADTETPARQAALDTGEAAPAAAAVPVPVPGISEPTTYGDAAAASRILIRSKSAAWVEITEGDGSVLLTQLLRPGDTFRVPDRPGITLVTGNAGGLEFLVDGAPVPSIGEIGDVRRDVLLEPDALLRGPVRTGD